MLLNPVLARRQVGLKNVSKAWALDHDPARDEARDGWTIFIITLAGLAAIQPDSPSFDTLNLAEKSERQITSILPTALCRCQLY